MARIYENGIYRDMTEQEMLQMEESAPSALTELVTALSTATTMAQMRSAAKAFLDRTEVD